MPQEQELELTDELADDPPRRGRPRSTKTREAVLAAARELLLESGYQRLTMEGVASRAGASKSTVYRWWPTKGVLVLDAAADVMSEPPAPEEAPDSAAVSST